MVEKFSFAAQHLIESAKLTLAITVAPLAILAAQVRFFLATELLWMKVAATIALLSLLIASLIAIWSLYYVRGWLAKEQLASADGRVPGRQVMALMERGGHFSEEKYVAAVQRMAPVAQLCTLAGWLFGLLLLLGAIWS